MVTSSPAEASPASVGVTMNARAATARTVLDPFFFKTRVISLATTRHARA